MSHEPAIPTAPGGESSEGDVWSYGDSGSKTGSGFARQTIGDALWRAGGKVAQRVIEYKGGDMPNWNNAKHALVEGGKRIAIDSLWEFLDGKPRREGFQSAEDICLGVLSKSIGELSAKIESGSLSKQEQLLLSQLNKLRTEMETALENYWTPESVDGENSRG